MGVAECCAESRTGDKKGSKAKEGPPVSKFDFLDKEQNEIGPTEKPLKRTKEEKKEKGKDKKALPEKLSKKPMEKKPEALGKDTGTASLQTTSKKEMPKPSQSKLPDKEKGKKKEKEKTSKKKYVAEEEEKEYKEIACSSRDFQDMVANLKHEFTECLDSVMIASGPYSLPFLLVGSVFKDNYAMIFCRNCRITPLLQHLADADFDRNVALDNYLWSPLTLKHNTQEEAVDAINAFLKKATAKGYWLVGCINEKNENKTLYCCFLQGAGAKKAYQCSALDAKTKEATIAQLNKLSGEHNNYVTNVPMFSNSDVSYQLAITVHDEKAPIYSHELVDVPEIDEINGDIASFERKRKAFIGMIYGSRFENTFFIYGTKK